MKLEKSGYYWAYFLICNKSERANDAPIIVEYTAPCDIAEYVIGEDTVNYLNYDFSPDNFEILGPVEPYKEN